MRILILGGTVFLGRHLVEAAISRGHDLTLFNRGVSGPGLFREIEQVHGDRASDLSRLHGRRFDAVIDTSGDVPRVVRRGIEVLEAAADHYTFVSTISVYRDLAVVGIREDAPTLELSSAQSEDVEADYGALKFLTEEVVREAFQDRALVVRPGLIVGPWDPTDRFTYWPYRMARGGDVLAPGRPDRRVQFIDARDLAQWILTMVERRAAGTYNANGPAGRATMHELLAACRAASGADVTLHWAPDDFLERHGVGEWLELPLWVRETPEQRGFFEVDSSRAIDAGLTFRPIADTVRDTLAWHQRREPYRWEKTGLSPEKEERLLAALAQAAP